MKKVSAVLILLLIAGQIYVQVELNRMSNVIAALFVYINMSTEQKQQFNETLSPEILGQIEQFREPVRVSDYDYTVNTKTAQ